MPLCVKCRFREVFGARQIFRCLGAGLAVVLGLGPGSDLSEVPVYQGVSRPRWNKSRPWVSSRTHHRVSCGVGRRRRDAGRRRRRCVV